MTANRVADSLPSNARAALRLTISETFIDFYSAACLPREFPQIESTDDDLSLALDNVVFENAVLGGNS